jgi:predicted metal-dependent enzyme (double-stranded beta helix superfamily)
MNTSRSSITAPQQVEADQQAVHRLTDLIVGVRAAVAEHADWAVTVRLVADQLRAQLPSPDVLTPEQRRGSPDDYCGHILYVEPDGSFSIVALVWRAGQCTRIHDHVTWCVFGVIQGAEHEELFDSIHIYGTDITRIGSSARRYYN